MVQYNFTHRINPELEENEIKVEANKSQDLFEVLSHLEKLNVYQEDTLALKTDDEIIFLQKNEVIFAEVMQKKLSVYTKNEVFTTTKTLSSLIDALPSDMFLQVTKSSVLNIKAIKKVEPSFSGNLIANLRNNQKVSISRRYVGRLKNKLGI